MRDYTIDLLGFEIKKKKINIFLKKRLTKAPIECII